MKRARTLTPPERAAKGMHVTDKEWSAFRIAQLDASVADLKRRMTPDVPQDWEIQAAIRKERDAAVLRVAELEAEVDRMIDAALDLYNTTGEPLPPYVNPPPGKLRRGRPLGKRDSKKRKPRARR